MLTTGRSRGASSKAKAWTRTTQSTDGDCAVGATARRQQRTSPEAGRTGSEGMGERLNDDEDWDESQPLLEPLSFTEVHVVVSENPVVAELLGPDGKTLRQWRARPPFGFRGGGETPSAVAL
jgi:hypothetical protein